MGRLHQILPSLLWLQGMPIFKKIMIAFYVVAGIGAAAVIVLYFIKKKQR